MTEGSAKLVRILIVTTFILMAIVGIAKAEVVDMKGVTITEDSIKIVGDLTPAEQKIFRDAYLKRMEENKAWVEGEIQRAHEKEVERLKYLNALQLEMAGATKVYVGGARASGGSVSNILNNSFKPSNTVKNSLDLSVEGGSASNTNTGTNSVTNP